MQPSAALNCLRIAFLIIILGLQPEAASEMLVWNNLEFESKKLVYEQMCVVCDEILKRAEESIQAARQQMPHGSVISFDGSWEHRRKASRCIFTVICQQTQKVVDSILISNKLPKESPQFCQCPQMMEAQGLRNSVENLKGMPQIVGYVHDNDGKARKIIQESGWEIREYLDFGHCQKCFERKLQRYNSKYGNVFKGIQESLTKWLKYVIRYDGTPAQRKQLWYNSIYHYCGNHIYCIGDHRNVRPWDRAGDPNSVELLRKFLKSTEYIIDSCDVEFSTQTNESYNRLKLKYATKDVKWGFTWEARMKCAVLDRNLPGWKFILYQRLGLPPLAPELWDMLCKKEMRRLQYKQWVHSEQYKVIRMEQMRQCYKAFKVKKSDRKYAYKLNSNV